MLLHAIGFLILLVVLWRSRDQTLRIVAQRSMSAGFVLYFAFWLLFCWSEWKPEYGASELFLAIGFSAIVGLVGALAYGLLGTTVLWTYRSAANRASQ
jgi:hypothetical protein